MKIHSIAPFAIAVALAFVVAVFSPIDQPVNQLVNQPVNTRTVILPAGGNGWLLEIELDDGEDASEYEVVGEA
jgi:hypothetical protein